MVVIKGDIDGRTCFLHQWDQAAERYQLIGGKKRDNATPTETAVREFQEEVSGSDWVLHRDFELSGAIVPPFEELAVSRTYGSLTKYEVHVYHVILRSDAPVMGVSDRWLSLDEIIAMKTSDGREVSQLCQTIEQQKPGILASLPFSIKVKSKRRIWLLENLEVRPSVFGVRVDLKRLIMGKGGG